MTHRRAKGPARGTSRADAVPRGRDDPVPGAAPIRATRARSRFRKRGTRSCGTSPPRPPMRGRRSARSRPSPSDKASAPIRTNRENTRECGQFRRCSNSRPATSNHETLKRDAHMAPQVIVILSCPTEVSIKDTCATRPLIGGVAEGVGAATLRSAARVTGDDTGRGSRRRDPSRPRRRTCQGRERARVDAVGGDLRMRGDVMALRERGYTWQELAAMVSSKGCRVTAGTLRTELSRKGGSSKRAQSPRSRSLK